MKKLFTLAFAVAAAGIFAVAQSVETQKTLAIKKEVRNADPIQWVKTEHDFGTIKMGPAATYTFKFKNTGTTPVTILSAKPGCSCTVSNYTKTPILPGQTGEVTATYETKDRLGAFVKSVTVTLDNNSTYSLTIKGNVSADDKPANGSQL